MDEKKLLTTKEIIKLYESLLNRLEELRKSIPKTMSHEEKFDLFLAFVLEENKNHTSDYNPVVAHFREFMWNFMETCKDDVLNKLKRTTSHWLDDIYDSHNTLTNINIPAKDDIYRRPKTAIRNYSESEPTTNEA